MEGEVSGQYILSGADWLSSGGFVQKEMNCE